MRLQKTFTLREGPEIPGPLRRLLQVRLRELAAATGAPGASAAVGVGGMLTRPITLGAEDAVSGRPMRPGSVFHMASLAKPVTAFTVMHLRDQGVLDIDAPIGPHLRLWRPAESRTAELAGNVTLRQLLAHAAGIAPATYGQSAPCRPPGRRAAVAAILDGILGEDTALRFDAAPGKVARYTSTGFVLVQLVLESLTRRPVTDLARSMVLQPLRMRSSSLGPGRPRPVPGHDTDGNPREPRFYPTASTDLRSTPSDLVRLFMALLPGRGGVPAGAGVVGPDTALEMRSPQARRKDGRPWGLGVMLTPEEGGWAYRHGGWSSGHWSVALASPRTGIVVAFSVNSDAPRHWGNRLAAEIFDAIERCPPRPAP